MACWQDAAPAVKSGVAQRREAAAEETAAALRDVRRENEALLAKLV